MTTIQDTVLNQEIANLDFSKVAALQQKRTVAFVNHFMVTTVQFLNSFMKKCEQQLMDLERKLEKVEAAMVLLEDRLSSIPEVNSSSQSQTETLIDDTDKGSKENTSAEQEIIIAIENTDVKQNSMVETHPEYDKFVKMVNVGVPLQAVKLKVSLEGLDPNILEEMLNK